MKRQLRAFHTKSTACSCEEKARIETRFGRLKETLLESTIIESHTRFVKLTYEKPKAFLSYGGDIIILIRGDIMIITYR